ncbi:MAG: arylsulfatase, partial [Verrucomicrobiota bacterium]
AKTGTEQPPNIILFLADDLGIGDVKCYGGDRSQTETPNFDRLAAEGVKFTDAHATASVCVPSRMSLLTGRYAWRFAKPEPGGPWGFLGPRFAPDQTTIASYLQRAGYRTAIAGKWHLGLRMVTRDGEVQDSHNTDFTKPVVRGPNDYGFAESFILPGSLDMYPYAYLRNQMWVGEVTATKGWSAFHRLGPAEVDFKDHEVLDRFLTEAEAFLDDHVAHHGEKPFFLYVPVTSPHTPTSPGKAFQGSTELGLYGDFVKETDDCLGRLLRWLDANELAENTLVIATSDHGAASYAGNEPLATKDQFLQMEALGHFSSGPYRGFKFSTFEGGNRVPFVVRWPAKAKEGMVSQGLVSLSDVVRTAAEAAGVELADAEAPDSVSFLPLLVGPTRQAPRRNLVVTGTRSWGFRDAQWKLILGPGSGSHGKWGNRPGSEEAWQAAIETFGRKPTRGELLQAPFLQLYHLESDPGETKNLASQHPERIHLLIEQLDTLLVSGRTTPGEWLENDVGAPVNYFPGVPSFARGW